MLYYQRLVDRYRTIWHDRVARPKSRREAILRGNNSAAVVTHRAWPRHRKILRQRRNIVRIGILEMHKGPCICLDHDASF